jgi:glucarate dehydratase
MKIRSIRATPVNIPFVAPYRFSYGSTASVTKTVIEVETDDGVVGLGECADGDRSRDVKAVAERLVGFDIRALSQVQNVTVPGMGYTPWGNVLAARRVFGGIEMALWDARGKTEGVPVHLLLGGKLRDAIALTEYFSFRLPSETEAGEATPVDIAGYCARMIERYDSKIFEGKMATLDLETEIAMLREIRAVIGERELRLDANGGWTVPTAREALRRIAPFNVSWFEEPVERYEEMVQLRPFTGVSFSTHIVDLPKAVALKTPDAIVTNLNELGGLANTSAFIKACERFHVGFRFHSGETGVGTAAYLHMSAAHEHVRDASQTLLHWYADDVIEGGPFTLRGGEVVVPDGPGLGVALDAKAFKRCHERFLTEGAFPSGVAGEGYGGRFRKR